MINNKKIGSGFEKEFQALLLGKGYWAHFIVPDISGQPFDVIAAKDGKAYAIDCKTSSAGTFSILRAEQNQLDAFDYWLECGNENAFFAVKHKGKVHMIPYQEVKKKKKVKINDFPYLE